MKRHLATLTLIAAMICGAAIYTQPESIAHDAMHRHIDGNVKKAVLYVQQLPFVRLLNWENEYQPRPTMRPLKVVPATETPYSPEELAEIYPTM